MDELRQLWSALNEGMTLRPAPPLAKKHERSSDWHKTQSMVTPGVTCFCQISRRNEITGFEQCNA